MNQGYVTFINDNPKYLKLLDILVESVVLFSKNPIEVFSINFDYIHSSDKVISRRIDLDRVGFDTICYSKLYSSINSSFDFGIQLDADFILTKHMDKLFLEAQKVKNLPICSLHTTDPNNQQYIMDILNVKEKSQHYVHATYLFSKETKDFLKECFEFSQYCLRRGIQPINYDETILNVMLWKNSATNSWIYPYDIWYETFLEPNKRLDYHSHYDLKFYSSHGCKDENYARIILDKIINNELTHI